MRIVCFMESLLLVEVGVGDAVIVAVGLFSPVSIEYKGEIKK